MKKNYLVLALTALAVSFAAEAQSERKKPDTDDKTPSSMAAQKREQSAKRSQRGKKHKPDVNRVLAIDQQVGQSDSNNAVKKTTSVAIPKERLGTEANKILVLIYVTSPSQPGSDKEFEKVSDIIITKLDLERPTIEGRVRTLDELIFDKLLYFEATYFYRIVLSDEIIDKYISSLKEQNHISDEQLRAMFKQVGYSYEEAREQLGMNQAIDAILNFKIKSRLAVSDKVMREFYDAHPEHEEASYRIKKAFIPDGLLSDDQIENFSVTYADRHGIEWSIGYWLADDEITDERRDVLQAMKPGAYSKPEQVTGGYEVIKLIDAKPRALKTFEDRYREIAQQLQEPQYYKMLDEFKKELLNKYELVYL